MNQALLKLPYALDERPRKTLGLIVLQSDETLEDDFRRLLPERDVSLYATRIPSSANVSGDTLTAMASQLPKAAALLPPAAQFDVIGFGCTSASTLIGSGRVAQLAGSAVDTRHVTNPLTAALAAFEALNVTRVAYLSPYVESVSLPMITAFEANNLEVPRKGSFMEASEERVARIDPQSIAEAAISLCENADVDGVFLSCTNLKTLDVIDQIEAATGKPVVSSNLALAWHMRSLARLSPPDSAIGRLFARTVE